MIERIVVVGASLAGLRAVEALRIGGYEGEIVVVGVEPHRPYDRPPLSKRLLSGEWEPDRIVLRKQDDMASLDVEWRLGVAATGLDTDRRSIALSDGSAIGFDGAILATGASPRMLPDQGRHDHVVVLRTLDDSLDLRRRVVNGGRRVVVIGAGFIGLEVASTARLLGNDVVVLEAAPAPLGHALGNEMGAAIAAVHADHGVEVRCNVAVEGLATGAVLVDGGWHEHADVVVVGIGVTPATDWLNGSGLRIRDGLVCRSDLNVGVPLVYAAGDIVRWHNPLFDEEMRIEHWTNASEQGALAAANLLAEGAEQPTTPYAPVPFFWSEQYDRRIQFLGRASAGDDVRIVAGSPDDRQFAALYGRAGRLRGVLGMNMPRHVMPFRNHLLAGIGFGEALALAAES
ncbi:MAG: FAD-dependent oxidoreductase [Ilumatobacter sp.]|uniref:NAD(P)/FAD-dependent oxidoreductase n=1 Tax=Ilumatobacter sp. TaxID=1967498 RepID=UPI00263A098A|nr:FAD-dependent oxidoreductase [Ilumatobacter sp.]MDJ0771558.1 FAD-dependent oxidoreductase [Ilumatobacter sp.]